MMRSFDDVANIKNKKAGKIPDGAEAAASFTGIKAPYGYKQEGDIKDRLMAAGLLNPRALKFDR